MNIHHNLIEGDIPEEIWSDSEEEEELPPDVHQPQMPVAVHMLLCFLLLWQFLFHVSDAGIGVLILFLHHFFHMIASAHPGQYLQNICKISAKCGQKSFLGALKIVHIGKVEFTAYVVCPSCHAIYDYI